MKSVVLTTTVALALASATSASVYQVATERVAYSGTVSRFGSLADAQSSTNAIGVHAIPARETAAPYNTSSRDLGLFFGKNSPLNPVWGLSGDAAVALTAWYYTDVGPGRYDGTGNPNNTNVGFMQLYDDNGSTVTSSSAAFGNFNGTHWTTLTMNANGTNATFDDDSTRLWNADGANSFPSVTFGTMVSYSIDITFGGLEGMPIGGGLIEANNHPTSVIGTMTVIFENTDVGNSYPAAGPDDNSFDGFYRADFTFNLDSWAFGQDALIGGGIDASYFLAVPAPGSLALLGLGGLLATRRRRQPIA